MHKPLRPKPGWYESPVAPAGAILLISAVAILLNPQVPYRGMDFPSEAGKEVGSIAYSLAAGRGFGSPFGVPSGPTAWIAPGFPFLIAGIFRVFPLYGDQAAAAIRFFNLTLIALTAILIFEIAKDCFGRRCAVLAAWLWALLPPIFTLLPEAFTFPCDLSRELQVWYDAASPFLLTACFLITLRLRAASSLGCWALYGLVWAITALVNPSLLSFLPVSLYSLKNQILLVRSKLAVASLLFLVCVAPWLVRNSLVFGRPTFLRDNLGAELRYGNCDWCEGTWSSATHPLLGKQESKTFLRSGEQVYIDAETRKFEDFVRQKPLAFLRLCLKRLFYFWIGPPLSFNRHQNLTPLAGLLNAPYLLCSILGLGGLWLTIRRRRPQAPLFAGLVLLFPLIYYVTYFSPEYRLPIEPELLILSAYLLTEASTAKG